MPETLSFYQQILRTESELLRPVPRMTLSQWADRYRKLSPESSVEPGQWSTDRAPYLREIMDTYTRTDIQRVVVMCSSQLGKSEVLLCILGYHIHLDPCPILFLQPTFEDAKGFSKERIAPMVRDTTAITARVAAPRSRDTTSTLLHKQFQGGYGGHCGDQCALTPRQSPHTGRFGR